MFSLLFYCSPGCIKMYVVQAGNKMQISRVVLNKKTEGKNDLMKDIFTILAFFYFFFPSREITVAYIVSHCRTFTGPPIV